MSEGITIVECLPLQSCNGLAEDGGKKQPACIEQIETSIKMEADIAKNIYQKIRKN